VGGRHLNESSGSTDEAEARRQLKVKIGETAAGKAILPGRATIGDLCALVIDDYRLRELRDTKAVEWRYKANVKKPLGRLPASRFGSVQVKQYILQRQAAGASNATINRELSIVRRGFKLGYEAEPKLVSLVPVIHKLPEDNARQGYHTGARKNELRRIQWSWVDFQAGLIRLPGAVTKNKKPRTLPIYGDMRRWLDRQKEPCPADCVWVFHGAKKHPVDAHLNGWSEACERADMPGLLFHDLRRSAVRNMKKAGLQDLEAMRISGHLTRNVFDRYNIIDEEDLADAGKRLEEYAAKRKQERAVKLRLVKGS
jgi:integrase